MQPLHRVYTLCCRRERVPKGDQCTMAGSFRKNRVRGESFRSEVGVLAKIRAGDFVIAASRG